MLYMCYILNVKRSRLQTAQKESLTAGLRNVYSKIYKSQIEVNETQIKIINRKNI